jgi:nicotinate-nucleotide adenylyltransferase
MSRLCFAGLRDVEVSYLEATLPRPSYTERTLEHIAREHPDWRLRFVMGSDALAAVEKWHDYERVKALAPPFVVTRRGFERPGDAPAVLPEVSSSRIRELFTRPTNDDAARRELAALVPEGVRRYVEEHRLYRP